MSAPMVRAILDGRKTQTRRVVKPVRGWEKHYICKPYFELNPTAVWWHGDITDRVGVFQECPYGKPGDRLWVRESFYLVNPLSGCETNARPEHDGVRYRATWTKAHYSGWKPSMFMPRWASRITLEVTEVRVQRLQDISEEDAVAEGTPIDLLPIDVSRMPYPTHIDCGRYAALWESINGEGSWTENPWVWAVTFSEVTA